MLHDPATDDVTVLSQWALFDASAGLFGMTPLLRGLFVGALSLVALRERGLWRWLGWFGLAVAAANVVGGIDHVIPTDWSLTGNPLVDRMAFLAWILLASVVLLTTRRKEAEGL